MASSIGALGAAATSYDPLLAAEAGSRSSTSTTVDAATGSSGSSSHKRDREAFEGQQGEEGKRPKEEAKAGTPTPPGGSGGGDELEALRSEMKRKEGERKALEEQMLAQLAKERQRKETALAAVAKLDGAIKSTLANVETSKANLAREIEARQELSQIVAGAQQLLGVAGREAVVPAIRALKEGQAGQGNGAAGAASAEEVALLNAERDAATKEAKEARAALARAIKLETDAKKRASTAEKDKEALKAENKQLQGAVNGAEANKQAALQDVEKKWQAANAELVALRAQLQQSQTACAIATRRADDSDAAWRAAKEKLDSYKRMSEEHMTQRNQYKERVEELGGQLAVAKEQAQAAEAAVQRVQEEAGRARAQARQQQQQQQQQQQGEASKIRFLEDELANTRQNLAEKRQELEAAEKRKEADAREKRRLDDGWTRETETLKRVRGERDAAERQVEAAKAGLEEEREKRRAAEAAREGLEAEFAAWKENYQQILAWIGGVCAAAGVPEGECQLDDLAAWVEQQAARQREAAAAAAAGTGTGAATPVPGLKSPGSVKAGKAPRGGGGNGGAAADGDEEEDEVGYSALAAKFADAQQQLNKAKEVLLDLYDRRPDVVPARWYGQVTEEEIQEALLADNTVFSSSTLKKRLDKLIVRIDEDLRNAEWQPFLRREGRIVKVDEENPVNKKGIKLPQYKKEFGQALVDLVVAKRRELEEHNSSGLYPFKLLTGPDGQLLPLDIALEMVVSKLAPKDDGQGAAGAQQGGGGGAQSSGSTSSSSSSSRRRASQGRR